MSPRSSFRRIGAAVVAVLVLQSALAGVVTVSAETGSRTAVEGDVATFTVSAGDGQTLVQVGSDEVNYKVNLTVDGGGTVTIHMNTYEAGGWRGASPEEVFSAEGGSIASAERETPRLNDPIDPRSYRIYTRSDGKLTDVGVLSLRERETRNVTVSTVPGDAEESLGAVENGSTPTRTITMGDRLVVDINATGLTGYVANADDLQQGTGGVSLDVYSERLNGDDDPIDIRSATFRRSGSHTYFVFETDDLDARPGDQYRIEFEIDGSENPYVPAGERESVTRTVTIRERRIAFDGEEPTVLDAAAGQRLNLSTTLAPGTDLEFEVVSEAAANPFVKHRSVTVSERGTASAAFDLTGVEPGTELRVRLRGESAEQSVYVERLPATPTPTPTATPRPTATTTARPTTAVATSAVPTTAPGTTVRSTGSPEPSAAAGPNGTTAEPATPRTPIPADDGDGTGLPLHYVLGGLVTVVVSALGRTLL